MGFQQHHMMVVMSFKSDPVQKIDFHFSVLTGKNTINTDINNTEPGNNNDKSNYSIR